MKIYLLSIFFIFSSVCENNINPMQKNKFINEPLELAVFLNENTLSKQELEALLKTYDNKKRSRFYFCKKDLQNILLGFAGICCTTWSGSGYLLWEYSKIATYISFLRLSALASNSILLGISTKTFFKGLTKSETKKFLQICQKNHNIIKEHLCKS
ncbi:hypothetical protein M1446_04915 [Candidatus Dependentiae bacterium]|nr:hypothetical protein [Candidatus Dependentiae bacterium]